MLFMISDKLTQSILILTLLMGLTTSQTQVNITAQQVSHYKDNLLFAKSGNLYDLVTDQGEVVLPFSYDSFSRTYPYRRYQYQQQDVLILSKEGKLGCVTLAGEEILPFSYDKLEYFGDVFLAQKDNVAFLINQEKEIISDSFEEVFHLPDLFDTCSLGSIGYRQNGSYGLLSRTGQILSEAIYDKITAVGDQYRICRLIETGLIGLVDAQHRVILPFAYESLQVVRNPEIRFLAVKEKGKAALIDLQGNPIFSLDTSNLRLVSQEFIVAVTGSLYEGDYQTDCYDSNGTLLWANQPIDPISAYDSVLYYGKFEEDSFQTGMLDSGKKENSFETPYVRLEQISTDRIIYVDEDECYGILSIDATQITKAEFDKLEGFYNNIFIAEQENRFYFLNKNGEKISKGYDKIHPVGGEYFIGVQGKEALLFQVSDKENTVFKKMSFTVETDDLYD